MNTRRRVRTTRRLLTSLAAASMLLAACGDDGDSTVPTTQPDPQDDPTQQTVAEEAAGGLPTEACDTAFAEVEAEGLEEAARACISLDDWIAADAANPDALGGEDPTTAAETVCDSGAADLADTPLCKELPA